MQNERVHLVDVSAGGMFQGINVLTVLQRSIPADAAAAGFKNTSLPAYHLSIDVLHVTLLHSGIDDVCHEVATYVQRR